MTPTNKPDAVLTALLQRYFELLGKEDMGRTPAITAEADELEAAIRKHKAGGSSK